MNGKRQRFWMCTLSAVLLSALLVGTASEAGAWATITVNSLADPGSPDICTLRDAITAADTMTATNGCAAGNGHDTIQFSVTGTIALVQTLPEITDSLLTINGPASPGITISGGDAVRVMQVASGTTLNLKNVTIAHGFVGSGPGPNDGNGAGIFNEGTLTIDKGTFSNNSALVAGGAIANNAEATISNSTFSSNGANSFPGEGGAIFNSGTITIDRSTFFGNHAFDWGGGIFNLGQLTVTNSTLSSNTASDGGGAFYSRPISGGSLTVINNTISGNRAAVFGGAIEGYGTVSVRNSIFSANSAGGPSIIFQTCAATITDLGYNISDDDTCGFTATGSLNNTDAMLDPAGLSSNGGPTQTIALLSGSPAIDAIPLADCTNQDGNPLKADQRGFPRPDADEQVCDIGAYETHDFAGTPGMKNCQGISVSALAHEFGNIKAAASALHFPSVQALQNAIRAFCKG